MQVLTNKDLDNPFKFYLIIFTLPKETRKMIEEKEAFKYDDEFEDFGMKVNESFGILKAMQIKHQNRFVILNYNIGLYLGSESLHYLKDKLFIEASIITLINPSELKVELDPTTKLEYEYLINQYITLNKVGTN